jgi:hypothetical protein
VVDFVEEIFGLFLPQLGMVKVDGLCIGRGQLQFINGKEVMKQIASMTYAYIWKGVGYPFDFVILYSIISLAKLSDKILAQLKV